MIRMIRGTLIALVAAATPAAAQDYPDKTISLQVTRRGGPTDTVARLARRRDGQGAEADDRRRKYRRRGRHDRPTKVKNAAPDGSYAAHRPYRHVHGAARCTRRCCLAASRTSELVGQEWSTSRYADRETDFAPKDLKELIAYVKANKDKVTFANAGHRLRRPICAALLFMSAIKTELRRPSCGIQGERCRALNDILVGGQVDTCCATRRPIRRPTSGEPG